MNDGWETFNEPFGLLCFPAWPLGFFHLGAWVGFLYASCLLYVVFCILSLREM